MASKIILTASVTQGAANAFAQVSINTGLLASGSIGYRIDQIQWEFPPTMATGLEWEAGLSRASKVAMPTLADDDLLWKDKFIALQQSAVGFNFIDTVKEYRPAEDLILIEEAVYFMIDSAAMAAAGTAIVRLACSQVKVTTDERIAILQSRLN